MREEKDEIHQKAYDENKHVRCGTTTSIGQIGSIGSGHRRGRQNNRNHHSAGFTELVVAEVNRDVMSSHWKHERIGVCRPLEISMIVVLVNAAELVDVADVHHVSVLVATGICRHRLRRRRTLNRENRHCGHQTQTYRW